LYASALTSRPTPTQVDTPEHTFQSANPVLPAERTARVRALRRRHMAPRGCLAHAHPRLTRETHTRRHSRQGTQPPDRTRSTDGDKRTRTRTRTRHTPDPARAHALYTLLASPRPPPHDMRPSGCSSRRCGAVPAVPMRLTACKVRTLTAVRSQDSRVTRAGHRPNGAAISSRAIHRLRRPSGFHRLATAVAPPPPPPPPRRRSSSRAPATAAAASAATRRHAPPRTHTAAAAAPRGAARTTPSPASRPRHAHASRACP